MSSSVRSGSSHPFAGSHAACRPTLARRVALALATAALATGALAAPALADTTIGQTGGDAFSTCGEDAGAGSALRADTNYVVPSGGGTITSFSYGSVAENAGQQLDFLVLRPAGESNYTVVGKTGLVTLAGTGGVETFAVDIDVQGGEILGIWNTGFLASCFRTVASGGGLINSVPFANPPDPSVGDEVSLPAGPLFDSDLNESANLVTTTTTPPPTIADLIDSVEALDLHHGIENALLKKLTNAQRNLDADDTAGACDKLASFIAQVGAQSGKKIDADDAEGLIDQAEAVRADLLSCA
jgi:FIMAH domain